MNNRTIKLMIISLLIAGKTFAQQTYKMQPTVLQTRWAKEVSPSHNQDAYPRPQLTRTNWTNLNGLWDYAIVKKDEKPSNYDGKILVPYPVESALSGVKKSLLPEQELWYKRNLVRPNIKAGERIILHFGAVDWQATVYLNGKQVATHSGGYTEFSVDVTDDVKAGNNVLSVKVWDPTDAGTGPHGKQVLNPANIYYTPSSGIWQTVWLEVVPQEHIESLTITPDIDKKVVNIMVDSKTSGPVKLHTNGTTISGKANATITVPVKNMKLWSPESPYLYDLTVTLGKDEVKSYYGMRKSSIGKDKDGITKIFLNNKPYFNLGTLDQGFWPDGLYTAPTDEALKFDIEAIKAAGFNTIRKHIKVEPARWYYYADKLGILVWQDMVNPDQQLKPGSKAAFEQESKEIIAQLHNYPSITTWVLFNERWGAYDQPRLTQWLKDADPSRIVDGHTGELLYVNNQLREPSDNPYPNSDMTDVHAYPDPMLPVKQANKAMVCGEFGGIGVMVPGHEWNDLSGWGYVQVLPKELESKYNGMIKQLVKLKSQGLSGSIYTQPFDVEGEENGLMTYDREVAKVTLARLKQINSQLQAAAPYTLTAPMKAVDLTQTDDQYQTLLNKYNSDPNQDSVFLRRLTLMAVRKQDQTNLSKVSSTYIRGLKAPYDKHNLQFIAHVTRTTDDEGFQVLMRSADSADRKLATNIVGIDIWKELSVKGTEPNLVKIEQDAVSKFGENGERAAWSALAGYAWNNKNWPIFVKFKCKLFAKYPDEIDTFYANNDAMTVLMNCNNKSELECALSWQKIVIERERYSDGGSIDTYANILYKLGRKDEAIEWETKAVAKSDDPELRTNLEKMRNGQPTW